MMHDVNIEAMTKLETPILALSLFLIKLTLHLWSKLHPDQFDGLGFGIQDIWDSAKEKTSSLNGSHHG